MRYEVWIDRGGTFTDCILVDREDNTRSSIKVLSSDLAPILAIRTLLQLNESAAIPPCDVLMGTTVATNALLERKGAQTALVISRGFADLLVIGDQTRPDLFNLKIEPKKQLYRWVFELNARLDAAGQVMCAPSKEELDALAAQLKECGAETVALVCLHSYASPDFERSLKDRLLACFVDDAVPPRVYCSAASLPEQGVLGRAGANVVDAYVSPLLELYLHELSLKLPGSRIRLMQSSGGLTSSEHFRGPQALLSGPAGGVIAAERIAQLVGSKQLIALDMGGTSTDVSLIQNGCELRRETTLDGIAIRSPVLDIHTIASGGGSVCAFDGYRLTVGPHSVGANPGPLCYNRQTTSAQVSQVAGPELVAITDVNLILGRVADDFFPFKLDKAAAERGLSALAQQIQLATGSCPQLDALASDFATLVTVQMAEAIRTVALKRGTDVRETQLLAFGGAAGQHGCAIARYLGIKQLVTHRLSGVLSAYGIGQADLLWQKESDAGRLVLDQHNLPALLALAADFEREGLAAHAHETHRPTLIRETWFDLRFVGTEASLAVKFEGLEPTIAGFHSEHERRFGYTRPGAAIETVTLRVRLRWPKVSPAVSLPTPNHAEPPGPIRLDDVLLNDGKRRSVPVYHLETLPQRVQLKGPALVLDPTGTLLVEDGFVLTIADDLLTLVDDNPRQSLHVATHARISILGHRFTAIASQMGDALRRCASSTNIRDRLDFSCAIFSPQGELVANAPHIPVHLGAMSATVRAVLARHPTMFPGDSFVSNDPALGGSHLPDITVITPVYDETSRLLGFTASRGHHADIGGAVPGSMPANSRHLHEEGVVLSALPLVRNGQFSEAELFELLSFGPYPARNPHENLADLKAQLAANQLGARLLRELAAELTPDQLLLGMIELNALSEKWMRSSILRLPPGTQTFTDHMDDGTTIAVSITVERDHMIIDFSDSSHERTNNLNAPFAVTLASVLYVLRTLVAEPLPLNDGCLAPVRLIVPESSILNPGPERAVAAGNVETSQRVVDVLLGALGLCAASQGTMNNLSFGNEKFGYYETIAGGTGAGPGFPGASAVHSHMTNTRITDPEVLEARFPIVVRQFAVRKHSGGSGRFAGGDGIVRELQALVPLYYSLLTERRTYAPFGLEGGGSGRPGLNLVDGKNVGSRAEGTIEAGAVIRIETPGGGGYGSA